VLKVLAAFNPTVGGKQIDLSRTYDPSFVDTALRTVALHN
jgi:hypothetical protein